MNRSPYSESFTLAREQITAYGSVQGAGAAAPVIPTTVFSATSSIGWQSVLDNFVSGVAGDIARSGVGLYTVKFKENIPVILDITVNVWGPNGNYATNTDYNPTTRILSFKTFQPNGTAADIAATDFVKFTITGKLVTEGA